jgi:hypothetical protein
MMTKSTLFNKLGMLAGQSKMWSHTPDPVCEKTHLSYLSLFVMRRDGTSITYDALTYQKKSITYDALGLGLVGGEISNLVWFTQRFSYL